MYTRTPSMTSFFVLGGSSAFTALEDELVADVVDEIEVENCILGFIEVEGAGLSS